MVQGKIILSTGYEIEIKEGWPEHLWNALVGDILIGSLRDEITDNWDNAMRLMILECDRLSWVYKISYARLIVDVVERFEFIMEMTNDTPPFPEDLQ